MEVDREKVTFLTFAIAAGGLANIFLLLSLLLTWKYWRQVKWYILMMAAANWLELAFSFGTELGWLQTMAWQGSNISCKLLMMMQVLGPTLANMAVAALASHTLLTVITGSQGDRVRILRLQVVFMLLSLPIPLTQIPMFRLQHFPDYFDVNGSYQCVLFDFFPNSAHMYGYSVGYVLATLVLPLVVIIVCGAVSRHLLAKRKGDMIGDEHVSDVIITGLLGLVVLVCCVPFHACRLWAPRYTWSSPGLQYWEQCRNIISALVTAAFAYLYVYRKRPRLPVSPTTIGAESGERQKPMD